MKTFDIALRVRAKHGIIYNYMRANNISVKAMAKLIGISVGTMIRVINFKWVPNNYNTAITEKLCSFFNCEAAELFPKEIIATIKADSQVTKILQKEQFFTKSIDLDKFISFTEVSQLEMSYSMNIDDEADKEKLSENVKLLLDSLTEQERKVVKMYFGIECDKAYTFQEIGREIGNLSVERARQIFLKAMGRLRRPKRVGIIQKFYEPSGLATMEAKNNILKAYDILISSNSFDEVNEAADRIRRNVAILNVNLEDIIPTMTWGKINKLVQDAFLLSMKKWR